MKKKEESSCSLSFNLEKIKPSLLRATLTVPSLYVDKLFNVVTAILQKSFQAPGFKKGEVPSSYIQQHFLSNITDYVREFCFTHFVLDALYRMIDSHKVLVAGNPRLIETHITPTQNAHFVFELYTISDFVINDWKHLPFKAPRRKKYKDLDRQALSFLKEEQEQRKECSIDSVCSGDWVNFTIEPLDENKHLLFDNYGQELWLKIGTEEVDSSFREEFSGKHIGEFFYSSNPELQKFFCHKVGITFHFRITIQTIVHDKFFCLDSFKRCFKLKTKKESLEKLIEVFSYQHDMSQRRIMAEKSLSLLRTKNTISIPNSIIFRQQKEVLDTIKETPDYQVYYTQKDFGRRIEQLAQRQTTEMLILDAIANQDNLCVVKEDIFHYLNLAKRPRTKEFVYFHPPSTKIDGQEVPISQEELKHLCRREKTLNYIIHHLTS